MKFEEVYERFWPKVYRLCLGYLNDPEGAKDLAQDTFVIIWKQLPKFRGEASIGTWVFRIASNRCLKQIEKQKRMPQAQIPLDLSAQSSPDIQPQIDFLYQCIAELAELDRLIISMELEDVAQAEIARILGLSEANVRVKIHRIKKKLSKKFELYEPQD